MMESKCIDVVEKIKVINDFALESGKNAHFINDRS